MDINEFIRKYQGFVFKIARNVCSNREDAEDVANVVLEKAWRYQDKVRDLEAVYGWLERIVVTTSVDKYRRGKKFQAEVKQSYLERFKRAAQYDLRSCEDQLVIEALLAHLTTRERGVIVLRELEGLSVNEVCEYLDISNKQYRTARASAARKISDFYACSED